MSASPVPTAEALGLPAVAAGPAERLRPRGGRGSLWIRASRPAQWVKAVLVFAAPVAALHLDASAVWRVSVAASLACAAASGTYLINDAIDVEVDREHPVKRLRPVAAGDITSRAAAVTGASVLLTASLAGAVLGRNAALLIAAYAALTVAYSTCLKRLPIVDVLTIAVGFVVRVLIGAAATSTPISPWFLAAVASGATMIAMGKRRGEVCELGSTASGHRAALATYRDNVTRTVILAAALFSSFAIGGWATIGGGGPQIGAGWACTLFVPALVGIARYVQLALAGRAARPERLVRDRILLTCAVSAAVCFVFGHAITA